jgi:hypothetical protein
VRALGLEKMEVIEAVELRDLLSTEFSDTLLVSENLSEDNFQGKNFKASIVNSVSMQLENVLVEQNQFQGLSILIKSYGCQYRNVSMKLSLLTAAQPALLPLP